MMNTKCLAMVLALAAWCFSAETQAQHLVSKSAFGNGGSVSNGGNFRIAGTVGQPFIGMAANGSHQNLAGFWYQQPASITTGVDDASSGLPAVYRLEQNYPNPFNPSTTIQFALPQRNSVTLKIFNVLGREVAILVNEEMAAGVHKIVFDAKRLASGMYFYRLQAGNFWQVKRLILMK
jgi:hypothetical protein